MPHIACDIHCNCLWKIEGVPPKKHSFCLLTSLSGGLVAGAISGPHRISAIRLSQAKFIHAGIVRIVHEVFVRIDAGILLALAGVEIAGRTTVRWSTFGRSIRDSIVCGGAASLERVVQTYPVTDFVGSSVAFVIWNIAGAGQAGPIADHAVLVR